MKNLKFLVLLMIFAVTIVVPYSVKAEEPADNTTPTSDTSSINTDDCDESCEYKKELETENKNPGTGSFAPYAIVIGGIVFSVGSIALARKNNKLYQV